MNELAGEKKKVRAMITTHKQQHTLWFAPRYRNGVTVGLVLLVAVSATEPAGAQILELSGRSFTLHEITVAVDADKSGRIDSIVEQQTLADFINSKLVPIVASESVERSPGFESVTLDTTFKEDNITGKDSEDYSVKLGLFLRELPWPRALPANTALRADFKYNVQEAALGDEREKSKTLAFLPLRIKGPFTERVGWSVDFGISTKETRKSNVATGASVQERIEETVAIFGLEVGLAPNWSLVLTDELSFRAGDKSSDKLAVGIKYDP
ncbi:MAG TPA: hypothetical protein VGA44_03885 [Steroidobacteraceae bacterium]